MARFVILLLAVVAAFVATLVGFRWLDSDVWAGWISLAVLGVALAMLVSDVPAVKVHRRETRVD